MSLKPDIQQPSIGGDVADFFGNLGRLETGEEYTYSMNPNGDPFVGIETTKEMVEVFAKVHPNDLDILSQRLDSFYEVDSNKTEKELPKTYTEAKATLEEIIKNK